MPWHGMATDGGLPGDGGTTTAQAAAWIEQTERDRHERRGHDDCPRCAGTGWEPIPDNPEYDADIPCQQCQPPQQPNPNPLPSTPTP